MALRSWLGPYCLLERIDQTPYSAFWRAGKVAQNRVSQHLYIEVLDPELARDERVIQDLSNPSLAGTGIDHPFILKPRSPLNVKGHEGITYDYEQAFLLKTVMERGYEQGLPFPIPLGLLVLARIVDVLSYAKSELMHHGLLHPGQVLINTDGNVLIKGLFLAPVLREAAAHHASIRDYYPQYQVPAKLDVEAQDTFACGVMLFEMLTHQTFCIDSDGIESVVRGAVSACDDTPFPSDVADLMLNCLDFRRPAHSKSLEQLSDQLHAVFEGGETRATTFDLAFFIQSVLHDESEDLADTLERERTTVLNAPVGISSHTPHARMESGEKTSPTVDPPIMDRARVSRAMLGGVGLAVMAVAVVLYSFFFAPPSSDTAPEFTVQTVPSTPTEIPELDPALVAEAEALRKQVEERNEARRNLESLLAQKSAQLETVASTTDDEIKTQEIQGQIARLEDQQRQLEREFRDVEQRKHEILQQIKRQKTRAAEAASQRAASRPSIQTKPLPPPSISYSTSDQSPGQTTTQGEFTPSDSAGGAPDSLAALTAAPLADQDAESRAFDSPPKLLGSIKTITAQDDSVAQGAILPGQRKVFRIKVLVSQYGDVKQAIIAHNALNPEHDQTNRELLNYTRTLKFTSPIKNGQRVQTWTEIEVPIQAQ